MSQVTNTSSTPFAALAPVGLEHVRLAGSLLGERQQINHQVSLSAQFQEMLRTGRLENFRIAAGCSSAAVSPHLGPDSDVYKWIEAAAYDAASCGTGPVQELLDLVLPLVIAAQEPDGYLNSSFLGEKAARRWQDLVSGHELYCGGHLIQAGVAIRRCTGQATLLECACRWADLVHDRFLVNGSVGTGGHPEVEMALVELFRETGRSRYLDLALALLDRRGSPASLLRGARALQDHLPVRQQVQPAGHAVRQMYLDCGMVDAYAETGDRTLLLAQLEQWSSYTSRRMAITGGAGALYQGEAFGLDYDLPNRTGYYETCAAIGAFMWNWRLLQCTAEARFADTMERLLYNGILCGVSPDGLGYFYTNPLEHDGGGSLFPEKCRGTNQRTTRHWDFTACCPPNVARLLASLGGYLYGVARDALYLHLYCANRAAVRIHGVQTRIEVDTSYPWDGQIRIALEPAHPAAFDLCLRIPGWAREAEIRVNGSQMSVRLPPGCYHALSRTWQAGDTVLLSLPMPIERVRSHAHLSANTGCIALMRGPLVYCIESADHPRLDLYDLAVQRESGLHAEFDPTLLGGLTVLRGSAVLRQHRESLYAASTPLTSAPPVSATGLTAVPYFAWANRDPGAMRVFIPEAFS